MRSQILSIVVFLGCMPTITNADANAGAEEAQACVSCHNAMVSLEGRGVAAIIEQMKKIRSGQQSHPPGLSDLREEDLEVIANYLNRAD